MSIAIVRENCGAHNLERTVIHVCQEKAHRRVGRIARPTKGSTYYLATVVNVRRKSPEPKILSNMSIWSCHEGTLRRTVGITRRPSSNLAKIVYSIPESEMMARCQRY